MESAAAVALCADLAESDTAMRGATLLDVEPRVESRELDPEWLVLLPGETESGDFVWMCVLGGDVDDPAIAAYGAFSSDAMTEERIERIRTEPESSPGWGANS